MKLLLIKEVAEQLRISPSLFYALVREGKIRHVKVGLGKKQGGIRVPEDALARFIEESTVSRSSAEDLTHIRLPS